MISLRVFICVINYCNIQTVISIFCPKPVVIDTVVLDNCKLKSSKLLGSGVVIAFLTAYGLAVVAFGPFVGYCSMGNFEVETLEILINI